MLYPIAILPDEPLDLPPETVFLRRDPSTNCYFSVSEETHDSIRALPISCIDKLSEEFLWTVLTRGCTSEKYAEIEEE